ncbi:MAG TPA: hypothetical protein HPQ00_12315, partial [Magnetococcales bacterium]|nr:hypothetical protein [Magnetococcales bacterium]
DLNETLLYTALESAYVDLDAAEHIHTHKLSPAPYKIADAISCWINRIRPIQLAHDIPGNTKVAFINPHFALVTGLHYIYAAHLEKYRVDVPRDKTLVPADEILRESRFANDVLYQMTWRNPSYKELSLLFPLLTRNIS